jgi:hypothetical protein
MPVCALCMHCSLRGRAQAHSQQGFSGAWPTGGALSHSQQTVSGLLAGQAATEQPNTSVPVFVDGSQLCACAYELPGGHGRRGRGTGASDSTGTTEAAAGLAHLAIS